MNSKEIKPSILREINSIFGGRTDAEAEIPVFWSCDANSGFIEKVPDSGKIEGRRRGCQRMRWVDGMKYAKNINLGKLCEMVRAREAWWLQSMAPQGLDMTGQLNNDDFA